MTAQSNDMSLNITQLFKELGRYIVRIVAVALICGIAGFAYAHFLVTPVYEARAQMVVNTREQVGENVTTDQVTSANKLIETYAQVIYSRDFLTEVIDNLDLDIKYDDLKSRLAVASVDETQIMQIVVRDTNAKTAKKIVEEITRIAPEIMRDKVKIGSLGLVDKASTTGQPVAPNKRNTAIICAIFGAVIVVLYVVLKMMFNSTYRTDIELQNDTGLAIIGVIPNIESVKGNRYGYYKYGKRKAR